MAKKKDIKPIIPPSEDIEDTKVPMSNFIDGIVVKLLSGRNNLKVLRPFTPSIPGSYSSSDVTTTVKSSQLKASLRYVFLPIMKP